MTNIESMRATRAPLTRERVLAAAVALADAEGIAAVTMRRVAGELGVEAMSLYHHLPGKADLLDGLVDVVAAEVATEIAGRDLPAEDWRAEVSARCLTARTVMLRHPWAPGLMGSRSTVPPVVYGLYEGVVGAMVRGGLSYRLAHRALHALGSMVLGFTQEVFRPAEAGGSLEPELAEAGLAAIVDALPYTAAMITTEMHDATDPVLGWCDSQTEFEFTLDLLLDGLERARA
ncbi:TetR/AcrR family transcriptional regulator [Antribacter sp. KLBMP9083]|uniref:TetR/AcrR family transcriptional regulator n=1 Tax=Antribacter soli TaxID=2910976 RepID=A0AA41QAI0_9MICO|nr:TetR/AcrR family transcriptional regulator C-terminal domain-containing protein [Antribacter soli]MCF4119708.1 TetR/AcrR family transcriptional regulator [Antribacter soli]